MIFQKIVFRRSRARSGLLRLFRMERLYPLHEAPQSDNRIAKAYESAQNSRRSIWRRGYSPETHNRRLAKRSGQGGWKAASTMGRRVAQANEVANIVIGVAYLKEQITDFFGDGARFGVRIQYSVHTVPGGTGEGFRLAISRYIEDQTFFALNGDQITDLRLETMLAKHRRSGTLSTIAVVHPRLPFGLVRVDKRDYCRGFLEKPVLKDMNISTGIYVFEHDIVEHLPRVGDVERTTFPKLSKVGKVAAFRHEGSFITINSLRELEDAEKQLRSQTD